MKKIVSAFCMLFSITATAQNVGIGETTPNETRLQVKRTDSALLLLHNSSTGGDVKTGLFFKNGSSYSGSIITTGNTGAQTFRMGFSTFGAPTPSGLIERISILDGGNVGIGTTNPTAKLEVNGSLKLTGGSPGAGKFLISDPTGFASWYDLSPSLLPAGASGNTLRHNGTGWVANSLLYNNGTNIGIGIQNPNAPLSFSTSLGNKIALWGDASGGHYGLGIQGSLMQLYSEGATSDIALGYGSSSAFTERMRVKGNGNIGIGTTNPSSKLEVIGNNTTQTGYFGQSGSGNAVTASAGSAATAISAFSTSASMPVVAITNVSGAPPLRIVDGNQGNGKVLTSDVNGNATWKSQAYGNTERFKFALKSSGGNNTSLETIYNFGTASTIYTAGNNYFNIYIIKSGLYHFDINAHQSSTSNYSNNGSDPKVMEVVAGFSGGDFNRGCSPFYRFTGLASDTYSTYDKSWEIYITAPASLSFSCPKENNNSLYRLNIAGHLISE
ncbi:hypothetical protein [Ferruginibacter sp.]|nr:hypothetical protein [Ferruginibacter sp.]